MDLRKDGVDVRVWKIRPYKGIKRTTYSVRWRVHGREHHKTFTMKLAEAYRSSILVAARHGTAFDRTTGLPPSLLPDIPTLTWYQHACNFIDKKWPHASPRHRKSLAEGLVTVTELRAQTRAPSPATIHMALMSWSFNTAARKAASVADAEPPENLEPALRWIQEHSHPLADLEPPATLRPILHALSVNLNGSAASPSTVARNRSAFYSALGYAVQLEVIASNPLQRVKQRATRQVGAVDRRVVVNPTQAAELLEGTAARIGDRVVVTPPVRRSCS